MHGHRCMALVRVCTCVEPSAVHSGVLLVLSVHQVLGQTVVCSSVATAHGLLQSALDHVPMQHAIGVQPAAY